MTIKDHSRLLAGFFFISGALSLLGWVISGGFFGGSLMGLIFAFFYMLTGWKLQNENTDARIFGIIASILWLPGFPLGTALAVYGLWFFFMRSREEF